MFGLFHWPVLGVSKKNSSKSEQFNVETAGSYFYSLNSWAHNKNISTKMHCSDLNWRNGLPGLGIGPANQVQRILIILGLYFWLMIILIIHLIILIILFKFWTWFYMIIPDHAFLLLYWLYLNGLYWLYFLLWIIVIIPDYTWLYIYVMIILIIHIFSIITYNRYNRNNHISKNIISIIIERFWLKF